MATVTQENIGVQHEKITIQLTKEDYLPSVDKALKNYSKNASIPGFRKGMVPVGMIRKMYGQSVFTDEVLRVAGTKLEEHLIENKAEIFARPIPAASQEPHNFDLNNPSDFVFEFEIGTRPEVEIPLLDSSKVIPIYKVDVTDAMVDEEFEKLQYKAGEMTEPETVTGEDNVLNVVFDECDANGNVIEGGIKKDNSLLVKYFTSNLQSELMGKKAGDSVVFNLKNTFDEKLLPAILKDLSLNPEDEASKEKFFKLSITKVGLVEKAVSGVEFFEKIYPGRSITTEEQFKAVLREEIQQYWNTNTRTYLHNELFETLVHETPINIPVDFLKRWMSVGGETYKSPEDVNKEWSSFDHQLRWQLITDTIAEKFEISVLDAELEEAAKSQVMSYFGQYGQMPDMDADWMAPLIKKQLADPKFKDELYHKIKTDKIFWVLEQKVNLQETEISAEAFSKLTPSHHHHH
ncbi:MAG TPA: trigger factor [Chitinophagaceae bacterium]|nr:trigger factor [Chitinophagaceae bacterium]